MLPALCVHIDNPTGPLAPAVELVVAWPPPPLEQAATESESAAARPSTPSFFNEITGFLRSCWWFCVEPDEDC